MKALPIFWLVCGLAFAGACFYGYRQLLSSGDNAEQMTHQIQSKKQSQQQLEEKNKKANFNTDQIKPVSPSEYAAAQLRYEEIVNQYGIGSLFIPSAGIQTKILAGMANENLMIAVGTYYPDQKLGKGNYVLLAHNLVEGGGALASLPSTKMNHVIYATDFTDVYEYKATKNSTVDQSNGQFLEKPSEKDLPIMTIFRCEGGLNTPSRALVQGEFVRSYPAKEATEAVKIGLGLGIMKAEPIGSMDQTEESTNQNSNKSTKRFKQIKPKYSTIEKLAIACFSFINKYPIWIGSGFLFVLVILERFTKRIN